MVDVIRKEDTGADPQISISLSAAQWFAVTCFLWGGCQEMVKDRANNGPPLAGCYALARKIYRAGLTKFFIPEHAEMFQVALMDIFETDPDFEKLAKQILSEAER